MLLQAEKTAHMLAPERERNSACLAASDSL